MSDADDCVQYVLCKRRGCPAQRPLPPHGAHARPIRSRMTFRAGCAGSLRALWPTVPLATRMGNIDALDVIGFMFSTGISPRYALGPVFIPTPDDSHWRSRASLFPMAGMSPPLGVQSGPKLLMTAETRRQLCRNGQYCGRRWYKYGDKA